MNMDIVIPSANYTIDASEKKIVLTDPYDSITAEQITSIRNITKNMLIYSASDPTKSGITIDPAGTINYNYDGAMEDTDIIRIEVNSIGTVLFDDSTPIDVNITNISLLGQSDVLEVYSSESVPASSTTSSTGQDVRGASYVIPYVKNATSTNLTVNIYGSYNQAGTIKSLIRSYTLTDTITQAGDPISKVPNYLFFDLVNSDSTNAATVSISVQRTVSTDVVRPYADVLEVYSSESVPASSTTSSTGQDVRGASYVILYVKNATSTSLTVNVFASPDSAGTFKALIGTTTLNATTKTQDEIELDKVPNYLFFDLVNSDSTNAATVSISVQRG
jgi:hypothetical protein